MDVQSLFDRTCFLLSRILFYAVLATARLHRWLGRNKAPGKRRIFIISDHRLGDIVHQIPLFEALRRAFPSDGNDIAIVVPLSVMPLVQAMPWFDEVVPGDARERHPLMWLLLGILPKAACRRVDVLIDTVRIRVVGHDWLQELWGPSASVAFDSRIAVRVFPFSSRWQKRHGDSLWTSLLPTTMGRPLVDIFQSFVDIAANNETKVNPAFTWRFPSSGTCHLGDFAKDTVILVPGSQDHSRRWPVESFRKVVSGLRQKYPELHFTVVGSPAEAILGEAVTAGFHDFVENLCGKTSLLELAGILAPHSSQKRIVVSNDTGSAHLAAVQGTQTIVILGGGEFGTLFPAPKRQNVLCLSCDWECFGCGWQCPKANLSHEAAPCIAAIKAEDVISAVESLLSLGSVTFYPPPRAEETVPCQEVQTI